MALTKQGFLIDEHVTFYNEGMRNSVIGQVRATERAAAFGDFLERKLFAFQWRPLGAARIEMIENKSASMFLARLNKRLAHRLF